MAEARLLGGPYAGAPVPDPGAAAYVVAEAGRGYARLVAAAAAPEAACYVATPQGYVWHECVFDARAFAVGLAEAATSDAAPSSPTQRL